LEISRKTGYKIFDRYQACGIEGLTDRSRRPYRCAHQLPFQVENFILNVSLLVPTRLCSSPFRARKRPRRFHSHHVSCCTLLHWQSYSGLGLQAVADLIRSSGSYRWVGLYDVNYVKKIVENIVFSGPGAPEYPTFPITKGLTASAISNGQTVNVGDVAADPSYLTASGTRRSEIIVPVFDRLNQKVVGIIDVESEQPFAFHQEVQSALENLAKEILKLWYYAEQFTSTPE
jgi:putative methionine-R-sulfoxide reductase with GAF domain